MSRGLSIGTLLAILFCMFTSGFLFGSQATHRRYNSEGLHLPPLDSPYVLDLEEVARDTLDTGIIARRLRDKVWGDLFIVFEDSTGSLVGMRHDRYMEGGSRWIP